MKIVGTSVVRTMFCFLLPEINDDQSVTIHVSSDKKESDPLISDDEEPSMLDTLSSEQLARRPSFKYVYFICGMSKC